MCLGIGGRGCIVNEEIIFRFSFVGSLFDDALYTFLENVCAVGAFSLCIYFLELNFVVSN